MTLLKTSYGTIVFDCGAAVSDIGIEPILANEFLDFLHNNHITVDDIKAVIVSHAHLDHYGSLMQLVEAGITYDKIYINYYTKRIIEKTANNTIYGIDKIHSISDFEDENIEIVPFSNGHILGSECYIVRFDNINILYTGDFCLHDQQTVKGLDINKIINDEGVQKYGLECVITESTYGLQKNHIEYTAAVETLRHFIKLFIKNNYKIFIPSFAIGRTQEIALILNDLYNIMIDGSAAEISYLYEDLAGINIYNKNTRSNASHEVRISNFENNDIILSSSGMITENSTSSMYIKQLLESNKKIAVVKTGYISSESYGESLLKKWINKNNVFIDIPLSAHAGRNDIFKMIILLHPKNVVTIHGYGLGIDNTNFNFKKETYYPIEKESQGCVYEEIAESDILNALEDLLCLGETMIDNNININSREYKTKCDNFFELLSHYTKYNVFLKKCQSMCNDYEQLHYFLRDFANTTHPLT